MSPFHIAEGLQLDLATAVVRIEQAGAAADAGDDSALYFLVHRLATTDAPRLRRYLNAESVASLAAFTKELNR